jgi:hypothetical protein
MFANLPATTSAPSLSPISATSDQVPQFAAPCARQHATAPRKIGFRPVAGQASGRQLGKGRHLRATIGGKSIKDPLPPPQK